MQKAIGIFLFYFLISVFLTSIISAQEDSSGNIRKTYYPNGIVKTEGTYWEGKLHGDYFEYYPNGSVWKKWHFFEGKEQGLQTWYFEDGKVSIRWNYKNCVKQTSRDGRPPSDWCAPIASSGRRAPDG